MQVSTVSDVYTVTNCQISGTILSERIFPKVCVSTCYNVRLSMSLFKVVMAHLYNQIAK